MKLIALGEDEVINLESIATAARENATSTGRKVKLIITFMAGQNATFTGDYATKLWKALIDSAI